MTGTRAPVAERLTRRLVVMDSGCIEWTGYTMPKRGYGQIRLDGNGKLVQTHRLAWELANGPIPDDTLVRHFVCDNPPCCNVTHLLLGTDADNNADMRAKGRNRNGDYQRAKTHCPAGHAYDAANTQVHRGKRYCKKCQVAASIRYVLKGKAARALDVPDSALRRVASASVEAAA